MNKAPWILASVNILPGKAKLAVNHEPSNGNACVSHLPPPLSLSLSDRHKDIHPSAHMHTGGGRRGGGGRRKEEALEGDGLIRPLNVLIKQLHSI